MIVEWVVIVVIELWNVMMIVFWLVWMNSLVLLVFMLLVGSVDSIRLLLVGSVVMVE